MSTPVKQDAHPRETIGVGNQTDDLKQNVPLETIRKALRKFLNSAGLITDSLPRESQSLQLKGVEFLESRYVRTCSISGYVQPS